MTYERIVSVFDTEADARGAVRALELEGFSAADVSLFDRHTPGVNEKLSQEADFWRKVLGGDVSAREAEIFGRTIATGGFVLSSRIPEMDVERAMKVLQRRKATEETSATKLKKPPAPAKPAGAFTRAMATSAEASREAAEKTSPLENAPAAPETTGAAPEQATPPAEPPPEPRIRQFVTERAVEAQVSLQEEHVKVERRPATAESSPAEEVDWSERTIELVETAEEAVVHKTVRLAEEVIIRKDSVERVRMVRDKVRRQQIEVEQPENLSKAATRS